MATVERLRPEGGNLHLTFSCPFADELTIDQSVSHNGVCLTVIGRDPGSYVVTAMRETLERSNLGRLRVGDRVNVERSMQLGGRLDGHIVQGHVDGLARVLSIGDADGSKVFTFSYPLSRELARQGYLTVEKGSVTVNGVSLTVCKPQEVGLECQFSVCIIPYTLEHTNFGLLEPGAEVNIEFDILGKYISRLRQFDRQ